MASISLIAGNAVAAPTGLSSGVIKIKLARNIYYVCVNMNTQGTQLFGSVSISVIGRGRAGVGMPQVEW